ncbi:hypothetical protein VTJ49DRAFT_4196 [Mycothermus thermophilus]|uniref:Protein kinase domain-containing protein n=1 Tax=Humicola insolens TaxID=85995 RepID=A0ABR3V6W9_HUMIN
MDPPPHRQPPHRPSHPRLHTVLPLPPNQPPHVPLRTASSTLVSSPGLFSPNRPTAFQASSETLTPAGLGSPYLHPLQDRKVRETHKANVEHDYHTGRKHINNYEIIEELGRGMHGKVKLAKDVNTGEFVAIKIIPRFSKKRRLGKVTAMSTQDKSKREIAILKKIRHPNVVALLEVIDDPELKKIYMVLEHVELGEVVWRKKGLPHICEYERRRIEREMGGRKATPEEERLERLILQRQAARDAQRARMRAEAQRASADYWSLEYGPADDEELDSHVGSLGRDDSAMSAVRPALSDASSPALSRDTSRAPSRTHSATSLFKNAGPGQALGVEEYDDMETPGAVPVKLNPFAPDGAAPGANAEDVALRGRSPSMADSLVSHMSSFDFSKVHDPYVDDYSYVPCFTMEQARITFRDTVLGLEYLHYEGVVHRDIKPANLLWTKDKRAKIADFGVSYFGRPVREGEPDDTVSESEARDFDNDLELAKTVGTPAFFAPELCATDLFDEPRGKPPKITEQIDVWSLGVTLYCLIYARLPFLAEDEWQMFRKIANEEVFIPDRRLRPVDPSTKPSEKSLYTRMNGPPYRDDDELAYEDVPPELQDLLRRMLTKDPEKRIRLREVKRHPWVMEGVDPESWLNDTDPSRRTSGKKIQVDEKDMAHAVVPLSVLDRAKSVVKKLAGKVMHPRGGDRGESTSRRRAASSAASSAGDSPILGLITPHLREARRRSLRPDDFVSSPSQQQPPSGGHPLTHSVLASPELGPQSAQQPSPSAPPVLPEPSPPSHGWHSSRRPLEMFPSLTGRDDCSLEDPRSALWKARDVKSTADEMGRARSVDRGLFASSDKRAEAKVSLSTAMAPGNVHPESLARPTQSIESLKEIVSATAPTTPGALSNSQHIQFRSDPSIHKELGRPVSRGKPPSALRDGESCSAPEQSPRKPSTPEPVEPAPIQRPPSPDDESDTPMPLSRGETIGTGKSSSSASMGGCTTPLTSPSESTSPIYGLNKQMTKEVTDRMSSAFQSDPSLPALLSGASSVSADPEGDFLGDPGLTVVGRHSVIDTTDSLTPPAFAKEPVSGFPLDAHEVPEGAVPVRLDGASTWSPGRTAAIPGVRRLSRSHAEQQQPRHHRHRNLDSDNDSASDSDSDEGLTMARRKKRPSVVSSVSPLGQGLKEAAAQQQQQQSGERLVVVAARRRDTNISIGSTETAKKVVMDGE